MFKNIGNKIQTFAKIFTWIGIVASVIIGALSIYGGLNTANYAMLIQGALLLIILPIISWYSGLLIVGYGKIIDNVRLIRDSNESISRHIKNIELQKNNTNSQEQQQQQ